MKAENKYQWHGIPVKTRFGYCTVFENKEKPLYWYNYECSLDHSNLTIIPAIEVTCQEEGYEEQVFTLSNHFGIGVHKLLMGGWPNCQHFSPSGEFTECDRPEYAIKEFDHDGFSIHEAGRDVWQKSNFPDEYCKRNALIEAFKAAKNPNPQQ